MCPPKKLARVAVGKPKKPAVECFNSSINSPPVISSNSLREQLSANNRNLNNFHVSPDSSPKSLRQHSHQQQTSFNNRDLNNYNVSPDNSPKSLRQHSQQQNRSNNGDINNYHVSPDSSPKNLRQHSQQQNRFNNRDLNNYNVSPDNSPKSLRQHSQQQNRSNNGDINNYHVSPDSSPKNLRQHSQQQNRFNNRDLNNYNVSPDNSPKSLRQHSQQQNRSNNGDINNYHVSPDSSPKNLRQHSQQQNRFNNRDLNNYHISLGRSPISSSQNSQQQTSFAPISSTPVHKRNLFKETQSDSNSLSVSRISHHKEHDAEPCASNIKLPNEIVDYLTKSMVRQDELFRVVQSLVASRPITTSEEEHDDFVEKLPDFPISSMEDFLSLESELLQKRFNIYFVRYLISLGGGTLADSSKLLLRHCLDKDVAIEYSHQGKGKLKKKPLNATEFYKAYKVALRKRHKKIYDDSTVNNCIVNFLRGAKDRKGGRNQRRKIAEEDEENKENDNITDEENEDEENEDDENEVQGPSDED
ncbi:GATA zinc finger domain-containing protein 14 isoform X2 [Daphnia magna]|uniref:GATA zinc finger domain-containing protein 14 isoform X2 n=1 Tax=Daphnia magna TaxID=35525 RepID=UPI001E1BBAB4|nr:GATA zinc finger domain-containing protein 14 isoform X2 [Daphnia magna]